MDFTWIFGVLPESIKYLRVNRGLLFSHSRRVMRRFFYKEGVINDMLFYFSGNGIKDDEFIHYRSIFDGNLYPKEGVEVKLRRSRNSTRSFTLPYVECINFISAPRTEVRLAHPGEIPQANPDGAVFRETKGNLSAYLKQKPGTHNHPILCMKRLEKTTPGKFTCDVGWTYFTEVARTNLTIDYPLDGSFRDTLRKRETALANGGVAELHESNLANFIGVSAVWCMDKGSGPDSKRYYYYLKCRRKELSVYYNMMGTTSGYVNPPEAGRLDDPDLMNFLRKEILREFNTETGYEAYAKANGFSMWDENGPVKVIPLALTRELARGGSPQLFFLIITPYINEREFKEYFKVSKDGKKEFRDSMAANRTNHPLSPETCMNLVYAYQWMQKEYNNDGFIKV